MVSRLMTRAFALIGYERIDDHHVSPPGEIAAALAAVLTPVRRAAFPPAAPRPGRALSVHRLDEAVAAGPLKAGCRALRARSGRQSLPAGV